MPTAFVTGWPDITNSGKMTMEEAEKKFSGVQYVPINKPYLAVEDDKTRVKYKGNDLGDYDAMFPRISISYKDWGYNLCKILSQHDIYFPYAPKSVLWAHNKFSTMEVLKRHNLPVPQTYMAVNTSIAREIMKDVGFPLIVKLPQGAGGKGVMYIESEASAASLFDTLHTLEQPLFIEEFIENPGEDLRVFVIGNEAYGYKRVAKDGEKRANLHSGGKVEKYSLSEEEKELGFKAAEAMKCDIAGVDLLHDPEGESYLIEVNVSPGLNGITKATGKNIAKKIVDFTYDKVKK